LIENDQSVCNNQNVDTFRKLLSFIIFLASFFLFHFNNFFLSFLLSMLIHCNFNVILMHKLKLNDKVETNLINYFLYFSNVFTSLDSAMFFEQNLINVTRYFKLIKKAIKNIFNFTSFVMGLVKIEILDSLCS